ncbi:MAG TPA: hypothetical protein VMH86_09435 [Rhizomicrobium sp.]|nr:hypothetical protein [Rhizomicrobium sp.]
MKMPVGDTLEGAFGFAFKSFPSVVGVVWFPYLLAGAIVGGAVYLLHPDVNAFVASLQQGKDPAAALEAFRKFGNLLGLYSLVFVIAGAMVRVGLMRKALGLHPGPIFIYFSFGAPVWRMIGASILLGIIVFLIVIAAIAGGGAAVAASGSALQQPARGIVDGVAILIAVLFPIYAIFRFIFFLPAVIVAEDRIGLGRSWSLGGGNVLRIIVVLLAIVLAVGLVFGILESFFRPPLVMGGATFDLRQMVKWEVQTFTSPVFLGLIVLQSLVTEALLAGASASGYRAVTGTAEGTAS